MQNVGLIYEAVTKLMASHIVNGRKNDYKKTKNIALKYFNPQTQLGKELQCFNILHKTNTSTPLPILERVKTEICQLDDKILVKEKNDFCDEMRKSFKDSFTVEAKDDVVVAIQTLFFEWRKNRTLKKNTLFCEAKIIEHMANHKTPVTPNLSDLKTPGVNSLLLKVLAEKINNKFGSSLTENQKEIIKLNGNSEALSLKLQNERKRILPLIESALQDDEFDQSVKEKLKNVKVLLEKKTEPTTENVNFYLSLDKLEKELRDS